MYKRHRLHNWIYGHNPAADGFYTYSHSEVGIDDHDSYLNLTRSGQLTTDQEWEAFLNDGMGNEVYPYWYDQSATASPYKPTLSGPWFVTFGVTTRVAEVELGLTSSSSNDAIAKATALAAITIEPYIIDDTTFTTGDPLGGSGG